MWRAIRRRHDRYHDDGGRTIAFEEQVVKVAILDGTEDIDGTVVDNREADCNQLPQVRVAAVIEVCVFESLCM
jgi:hypothetical protein